MSCKSIAKELLELLRIQPYLKPVPFAKDYSDETMKNWSKKELMEQIHCLHHNYLEMANSFDRQSDIFIKFFTENKGKIKVTLEYKGGKDE